jgi:prolyl-tRNA editing enzyme YbaK/EbsC (Cys-tRNA(Pro) deacylase)
MVLVRDDVGSAGLQLAPALQAAAAPAAAVCVLLLAGDKVDLRAVAQHMQLPRGSLRLATAEEAVSVAGYELGCIPPLGEGSSLAAGLTTVAQLKGQPLNVEIFRPVL